MNVLLSATGQAMLKPLSPKERQPLSRRESTAAARAGKVCILNSFAIRPNAGGPIGVIRDSIARIKGRNWELRSYAEVGKHSLARRAFHRAVGPMLWNYPRKAKLNREIEHNKLCFSRLQGIDEYPLIWFHDLISYFACRPLMTKRQGAVLQLHHPELPAKEASHHGWYNAWDVRLIERLQDWALRDSDVLVLANRGASRIYGGLLQKAKRVTYLPNAICETPVKECPRLSSDLVSFVFLGRRNAVKGFDLLIDAFRQARAINGKLTLYVIGEGAKVEGPGVVDLGFSSVPETWLAAADCVVVPNRSSYLDLNVLQALSLNKPVLMTCSHGHQDFKDASSAIYAVEEASVESLRKALLDAPRWLSSLSAGNLENRQLYEERYSLTVFAKLLDEVCADLVSSWTSKSSHDDAVPH